MNDTDQVYQNRRAALSVYLLVWHNSLGFKIRVDKNKQMLVILRGLVQQETKL